MFANDTAYKLRVVRDAVRIGYTVSEGLDKAFGPFRYQQQGPQWSAVTAYLADAIAIGDSDATAARVESAVDAAYLLAYNRAAA